MKKDKPKLFKCREKAKGCEGRYEMWTANVQRRGVCRNPACLFQKAGKNKAKAEAKKARLSAKQTREGRESLKTVAAWKKEAQAAFNRYIRMRDSKNPCICCGVPLGEQRYGGGYDCGHFRSIGSAPHLRFNEDNAHGQNKKCNRWLSGNYSNYRIGLIAKIGIERVENIEKDNVSRKYSIADLKEIKEHFMALVKEIKAGE